MNRSFHHCAIPAPAGVISGLLNFYYMLSQVTYILPEVQSTERAIEEKYIRGMFWWRMNERDKCFSTIFSKSIVAMTTFLCCNCTTEQIPMCRLLYYRDARFKTGNQFVGLVILSGIRIVLCTALNGGYIDSDLYKQNVQVGKKK